MSCLDWTSRCTSILQREKRSSGRAINLPLPYRQRLAELKTGPLEITETARLVHGSARDEDEYVVTQSDALVNLALQSPSITFFGHTHEPGVFTRNIRWLPSYEADGSARLHIPADKILVNPGSVGQPRDGDARASFLIWDEDQSLLEFYRVDYPVATTQARMRDAELPEFLITRLGFGALSRATLTSSVLGTM